MVPSTSEGVAALNCPQCGAVIHLAQTGTLVCQFCGSCLIWKQDASRKEAPVVLGVHLLPFSCGDPEVTGLEVFRMLIPAGWQARGGCRWLMDNPGMPAVVSFQVWNPHGQQAFEILPNMNFTWSNNPLTGMLKPPGSRYFGAEVRPPVDNSNAFSQYILPRFRSSCQDLQVIQWLPQPDLPRLVKSEAIITPGASAEGGKVRIQYSWQGLRFEEEIFGVVEVFRVPLPGVFGPVELAVWFIDYLFSFRAAAGTLDATAPLFLAMLQTFCLNPNWSAAVKTISQQLSRMQIEYVQHIGQMGEILASAGREMRDQNLNEWEIPQSSLDRLAMDRSRAIRGVDGFFDPHREEVVELPSGYSHAWANNLGEYILTEDPNFNPNLDSSQHWEMMQQQ